mmetsp:Transcript_46927/g.101931  ORF Transcript_46927/g.101931 Transcript_46927/m.101931 type:complete len:90 (-) Transcript_46927:657-926(-)
MGTHAVVDAVDASEFGGSEGDDVGAGDGEGIRRGDSDDKGSLHGGEGSHARSRHQREASDIECTGNWARSNFFAAMLNGEQVHLSPLMR